MIAAPGFLWTIIFFILAIGPLIFVHELGHYLVGRWFGVKAEVFSIGFGREIAGWTDRLGTRWKIGWLPLGGYVRFAGEMIVADGDDQDWKRLSPADQKGLFQSVTVGKRALIVAAGPVTNFLVAFLILMGFALAYGESRTPPVVAGVETGSVAALADIRVGDRIVKIQGRSIGRFDDVYPQIQLRPGLPLDIEIVRGGVEIIKNVKPAIFQQKDRFGNVYKIGRLGIAPPRPVMVTVSWADAPRVAADRVVSVLDWTITGIFQIITGRRSASEIAGPIRMAKATGEMATLGWQDFVVMMSIISINLGFINLLPVPMLDGGHLSFYAVEAIRKKPVSSRAMELAFRSGMMALFALMIFVTVNDLASLGIFSRLTG